MDDVGAEYLTKIFVTIMIRHQKDNIFEWSCGYAVTWLQSLGESFTMTQVPWLGGNVVTWSLCQCGPPKLTM